MAISPDGKRLLFNAVLTSPEIPQGTIAKLALVSLDAAAPTPAVLLQPDPRVAPPGGTGFANSATFTPDGRAVAYIIRDKGVDNIFAQPIDGSAGRQITNFTSEHITQFQWSPDRKTLAVARSHDTSDVVLLREK